MCTVDEFLDATNWTVEDLKLLLEHDSSSINEFDETGLAPLHRLLTNNTNKCTPEIIKLLIQHGADVNLKARYGCFPLEIALSRCLDKTIIKALLDVGIDHNNFDESVLCTALYHGNSTDVIRMLVDVGFPMKGCNFHPTIFHCALDSQKATLDEGLMKMLLDSCKDVNFLNTYRQSLLCLALSRCKGIAIAQMLIDAGCSTKVCEAHPSLWLCATSYSSKLTSDIVELIAKNNELDNSLEYVNELGENPIMMALRYGKYELGAISLLLNYAPQHVWNVRSHSGDTVLHSAVANLDANPAVVTMLVRKGAQVNAVNNSFDTPLHIAVAFEDYQLGIIKALILNKANINANNGKNQTPLSIGINRRLDSETLQLLLRAGARINDKKQWSYSLLNLALRKYDKPIPDFKCLKLFIKYALLDNPEIDVRNTLLGMQAQDALIDFAHECRNEISSKLAVKLFDNLTLLQFLQKPYQREYFYVPNPCAIDADKMCDILCENGIHVYLDAMAARIGRSSLTNFYLHHIRVYTVVPEGEGVKTVRLNYESILHLANFLANDEDILRLSLAFHRR